MTESAKGQVSGTAAEVYNSFFVPALFQEWAAPVAMAAKIKPGDRVLDVASGTGVLAREAAKRAAPGGSVVGLDRNDGMLAVARNIAPEIGWQKGMAESLPYPNDAFDAVVCQFGLMFFDDRAGALKEMWRVLKPGGHIAIAVWDALERTPGYADMVALLQRLFGDAHADALRAPFVLGDRKILLELFEEAGIPGTRVETRHGTAVFPSLEDWVHTDVKGWTLADMIDDTQFETLRQAANENLQHHAGADGSVKFPSPAHIVTATKPVAET
jgi:SAM-dependent methyltransferase